MGREVDLKCIVFAYYYSFSMVQKNTDINNAAQNELENNQRGWGSIQLFLADGKWSAPDLKKLSLE